MLLSDFENYSALMEAHFSRPRPHEEHDEVLHQLAQDRQQPFLPDHVRAYLETLRDKRAFLDAVRRGQIKLVSAHEARSQIGNTGDPWHANQDREKKHRVAQLFRSGKQVASPIVLHNQDSDEKWLLAGHHRLSYNSQIRNRSTPVLHLGYRP